MNYKESKVWTEATNYGNDPFGVFDLSSSFERSQQDIILEHLEGRHQTNWYDFKPYKSIGCILHWLYVYTTLNIAETAIVGNGKIWTDLSEKILFATFIWNDKIEMPIFTFMKKSGYWYNEGTRLQAIYLTKTFQNKKS